MRNQSNYIGGLYALSKSDDLTEITIGTTLGTAHDVLDLYSDEYYPKDVNY